MKCILCGENQTHCVSVNARMFFECPTCDYLFLDPALRLSPEKERLRYEQHQNDIYDEGYQDFVRPLVNAISELSPKGATGLDFGAGRGSAAAHLLESADYRITKYDPYFRPEPSALQTTYDFVFACEVVEHLREPAMEFARLRSLLKPNGILAIMTMLRNPDTNLSQWHYLRDTTHIGIFSTATFDWLSRTFKLSRMRINSERVIALRTL